ncbi:calnexin-like protein precursor [Iris pallida]|uniref:Calnexin-like protein n=1 Tax=Iris pallida TaxID=29817 RepID=A0AAX6HPE3_IRIPA|nr:calnexin-like protein precursor [Iris pallida]
MDLSRVCKFFDLLFLVSSIDDPNPLTNYNIISLPHLPLPRPGMASTRRTVGVPCHRPPSRSNSSSITIHLIISNLPSRHGLQRPPLKHSLL